MPLGAGLLILQRLKGLGGSVMGLAGVGGGGGCVTVAYRNWKAEP